MADDRNTAVKAVDIRAQNHGSIWILIGVTGAGDSWLEDNVGDEETLTWCGGIVVEPRYVEDIVLGARKAGLEVTVS